MESTINFIEVIKKNEAIYNTTHADYKNAERKSKAWSDVANEVGVSVDAAKRKWKNLRDSYTKYLRSFRTGTKTSRKYQYWAHAELMEFLRPFQGPGRSQIKVESQSAFGNSSKSNYNNDSICNFNYGIEKYSTDEANSSERTDRNFENKFTNLINGQYYDDFNKCEDIKRAKDIDSTSLFFLSLAKSVRSLPLKQQTLVKMRCMKIVSDAELEMETSQHQSTRNNDLSYRDVEIIGEPNIAENDSSEHFLYVMSPSRVEAMIDISSDEEQLEK